MWWWFDSALAASVAGLNVPFVGGGFAGPGEHGALGLLTVPSEAVLAEAPEVALDLAFVGTRVWMSVDALGELGGIVSQVQPTLMGAVPFADGRLAIGGGVFAPYVRSGEAPPDGPFRLFSVSSKIQFLEADVVAAGKPVPWLALGATLRLGQLTVATTNAIDTGAMLNASLHPETPLPYGDPLLEGHQTVDGVEDWTASFALGASLVHPKGAELHVAYRPAWRTGGQGSVVLVPSDDFVARIEGTVGLTLVLPPSLDVSARIPFRRFAFVPEVQWVGWDRTGHMTYDVRDLALTTSDPVLDGILSDVGLSESAIIESQEGTRDSDLDWDNVLNVGLYASYDLREDLALRAGVWRGPNASQDRSVSPGNLDFAVWDFRAGADWRPFPAVRAAFSLDVVPPSVRRITDSKYDLLAPSTPEDALPSGNGSYELALVRAGVTLIYSFRGKASASPSGSL